jgi:hypothetical protein
MLHEREGLGDKGLADNVTHDLVGALQDLVHPHIPQQALHLIVLRVRGEGGGGW